MATLPEPRLGMFAGLGEHLRQAIELKHATLPSYLTAPHSPDPGRGT
ncbi:hypothetical protein [Streptosporangium roseum]|nr:hypothetical protein [Streptosporangium roseum]